MIGAGNPLRQNGLIDEKARDGFADGKENLAPIAHETLITLGEGDGGIAGASEDGEKLVIHGKGSEAEMGVKKRPGPRTGSLFFDFGKVAKRTRTW